MTSCAICQGRHTAAVDTDLAAGVSTREVAARYALSKSGVARHRSGCLQPKLAAAARIVAPAEEVRAEVNRARALVAGTATPNHTDILSLTGLLDRLARSLERLEGSADAAAGENLHTSLAAVSAQLHRGIESAAKIQGLYAEPAAPAGETRYSVTINLPSPGDAMSPRPYRDVTPGADKEPFTLDLALPARSADPTRTE